MSAAHDASAAVGQAVLTAPIHSADNPRYAAPAEAPAEPLEGVVVDLRAHRVEDPYAAAAAGALAVLDADGGLVAVGEQDPAAVWEDLVERWLLTYSPNTATDRRACLRRWADYCRRQGQDPLTVGADVVRAYQQQLEAQLLYLSARHHLAAVRAFYRFLLEERERWDDPALGTTRRPPARLAAALAVQGQDRSVEQLAVGFLLGHTPNTRRSYDQHLRAWFTWCQEIGVDPLAVQRPHVDAYKAALEARYAPASVKLRLTVVRAFYAYCVEEEAVRISPARSVRMPRLPNVSTSIDMSREEVQALLRAARDRGPMEHALFTLLALNGLRVSEALGADVEDLTTSQGHQVLMIQRKGYRGSRQAVPLAPRTRLVLDTWLEARTARLASGTGEASTGPLFTGPRGARLSRQSAWTLMRVLAKGAVPHKATQLHPHNLRNAFVTLAMDAGVSLRDVQDSAGHASAETTRRYDTSRNVLNRNATYWLAGYIGGSDDEQGRGDA